VNVTEHDVREALSRVMDPEIPTCSITDLGIVERVAVDETAIEIDLLPTFAGCPALDAIREDVETAVRGVAASAEIRVRFVMDPPWTTERISDAGVRALAGYGIAGPVLVPLGRPSSVQCPYCGSMRTHEDAAFGPTPCRTIQYCEACRNPFEGFKTKSERRAPR